MTSEIRVNKLTNRIGLSTVTFADSGIGVTVTGRIDPDTDSARDLGTTSKRWRNAYVDTYYGDGSNLTGIAGVSLSNGSNNRVVTATGAAALTGESNLTFTGSILTVTNSSGASELTLVTPSANDSGVYFNDGSNAGALSYNHSDNSMRFRVNLTEKLRIDTSGRLLVNTTSTNQNVSKIVVKASSPSDAYDNHIYLEGSETSGNANTGGVLGFGGHDGGGSFRNWANIWGVKENGTGGNTASYMAFHTRAAGGNPAEKLRIDSNGRVFFTNNTGNGTSRVGGRLELSQNNPETWITINESSDSGTGPALYINRTRGSNVASPGPVENGNYIGSIHFGSYDTNSYEKGASIQVKADGQTWANGDCPARLAFYTTPDGGTSPREWMRISNDGSISFARGNANTDPSHNPTVLNGKHRYSFDYSTDDSSVPYRGMRVYGSYGIGGGSTDYSYAALFDGGKTHNNCQNQYITFNQITQQLTAHTHGIYCQNSSSYGVSYCYEGKMMKNLGAYTNSYTYHSNIVSTNSGGSAYHFRGADNDTTKVLILQNGDLDNANNSYSGLSDIKLKENIVDAGSQWDDIKNLKVRKFNFKAETGHETHTQIGLIAQETEPVSAGLVYEENDIIVDESTGEGTVTGTTKHIKYSVLYMKAVKALQEAMTRIETLEQDNIALRARITNLEGN